jgi:imidazolonepropionase
MRELGVIQGGAMLIEDGRITNIGPGSRIENLSAARGAREWNADGRVVMPGLVDSHTHAIYGMPRLRDYEMRLEGYSYEEIAREGGGILSSMRAVRGATSHRLSAQLSATLQRMANYGTTTAEIKSGYGLNESAELKMLRVARAADGKPIRVASTLLGAHAVPPEFEGQADGYIDWLCRQLIPKVARLRLARYADAYCDANAFTVEQTCRYLRAARESGLGLRLHANQFADLGAVQLGIEMGAASVDHLEAAGPREIQALADSSVYATLLPGSVFHMGLPRYAPARQLIDAGAAVVLATDCNPGTSPTCSMQMVMSLACTQMRMMPAEAITASTINAANSLGLGEVTGSLEVGKFADFLILSASDFREIPYFFGVNHVAATVRRGEVVWQDASARTLDALK